jgi:hypothetical protein
MSMIANRERIARQRPMGQLKPNATECTTIRHILRAPRRIVGQVFRGTLWVRRIGNPPAAILGKTASTVCGLPLCGAGLYPARRFATGAGGLFTSDSGRLQTHPTVLAGCPVLAKLCGSKLKHPPPFGRACFSLPISSRLLTLAAPKRFPPRDPQGAIGQVLS